MFGFFFQILSTFSFLVLSTTGLAIIFGVMNIINFAHASFIMLGAVTTVYLVNMGGLPLFVAIPIATLLVAAVGAVLEFTIIRRLYDRKLDCLLATWAVNIIVVQLVFLWLGTSQPGIDQPFGAFSVQGTSYNFYEIFLACCAAMVLAAVFALFHFTQFGLHVRAAMQNRDMAEGLGANTTAIYLKTFALGAAMAGLTGALYAPLMPVSPYFGDRFLWRAFTVLIVGGADPLVGPFLSSIALGGVYGGLTWLWDSVAGSIGILVVTMVFIRLLPSGFTGLLTQFRKAKA
ncbi:branched-chain amino acid ABC transporter permease [Mesorhizobium sp.]|uniref:branched-chain amino acid ABC transporter permease n=1 Tax=Mesorhizobium sp. TaxID=1871066 RepID=UPI000FE7DF84|nr:branched-chain amino acid ABC transporter permease [Mesorhizobium sp.]RWP99100.1 MAG: branched-chain amino acid ABC transporter permease [Mesorhizobium sp.]RWQ27607.1 MAG: branched-chain amino acid ABC transporter permease [Mesorhizobium sp.]